MSCATIEKPPMDTAKKHDEEVNTDAWLTCVQVSDLCGISLQTVRNYSRPGGPLKPRRDRRVQDSGSMKEVWVYDPREIAKLPKRKLRSVPNDPGEIAARAFEMFDDGAQPRRVVTVLRETPARVMELHEQWLELGGSDLVIGKAAKEEIERIVGSFDGVASLVERLTSLARRTTDAKRTIDVVIDPVEQPHLAAATDGQVEDALVGIMDGKKHKDDVAPVAR